MWQCGWLLKEPLGFYGNMDMFIQSFQRVHDVHGGLSLGVLGVSNGITDHVLQEHLQHTAGLLVDQTGDTLDSATHFIFSEASLRKCFNVYYAQPVCVLFRVVALRLNKTKQTQFRKILRQWLKRNFLVQLFCWLLKEPLGFDAGYAAERV